MGEGLLADTPITIMDKDQMIDVISIEQLYRLKHWDDVLIWSVKKVGKQLVSTWTKLKSVIRFKTEQRPFQIMNNRNWLQGTQGIKLALKGEGCIRMENIKHTTPLLSVELPYSDVFDLSGIINTQPEPGEYIEPISEMGNRECDICDCVLSCPRRTISTYYHCLICPNYDLCEKCHDEGYINEGHTSDHKMRKRYGYSLKEQINANNCNDAEKALFNLRDPYRYWSIEIFDPVDAQIKMILAEKAGYFGQLAMGNVLTYMNFDSSFEAINEEYLLTLPENEVLENVAISTRYYNKQLHEKYNKEFRVAPFIALRSNRYNGRRHLLAHGEGVYVGNFCRYSFLVGEHYVFNANLEHVYMLSTESGYFQCGIGGLIVKCR